MAHAAPPSALEQGGPIRVEHDRQRRQFSVRLNGIALPLFARARARGRDGAGPAGGRIPGREGSRTPTGTAGARPPGQPAPASAAGFRHSGPRAATLELREQVAGALPPPGCLVASCRPGGAYAGLGHNTGNLWSGGGGG